MKMMRLDPPPELAMPIGQAMYTQRAIRRLDHNRPIGDAQIKLILDAASKAPSGGNTQPARFVVIRSRERIREFGALYREAWWAKRRDDLGWTSKDDIPADSMYRHAALLADEMADAPLVILAFAVGGAAHSVFPAVQSPARGTCARHRLGAHHPSPAGHGARVYAAPGTRGGAVSLLHPTRLPGACQ